MKYIIYLTTNKVNNKIYIGIHLTLNPDVFDGYLGCGVYRNNNYAINHPSTPFQYAVKKYGFDNFVRKTLKIFDNLLDALDMERFLVDPEFINRKDTYNATLGGGGGSRINYIHQFDLSGNFIKTWNTVMDASLFYCVSHTAILNAVNFKGSCRGYYWSYNLEIDVLEFSKPQNTVKCYQYSAETRKMIEEYPSIKEAAKALNIGTSSILASITAGFKIKNYYFSTKVYDEYPVKSAITLARKTVYVYDKSGKFVKEFSNLRDLRNFLDIKNSGPITKALRGTGILKNYRLSLEKLESMDPFENTRKKKRVGRYSKTGELLETFESVTAAQEKYNTSVRRCLKGQQQFCHGFIFRYL